MASFSIFFKFPLLLTAYITPCFPSKIINGRAQLFFRESNVNLPESPNTPRARVSAWLREDNSLASQWLMTEFGMKVQLGPITCCLKAFFFFFWGGSLWESTQSVNRQAERTRKLMPPKSVFKDEWGFSRHVPELLLLGNQAVVHSSPTVPQEDWVPVVESGNWLDKAPHIHSLPFSDSFPTLYWQFLGSLPK